MECTNLKSVSFPTNYFRIAPYAFEGRDLELLNIPKIVAEEIGLLLL